MYRRRIRQGRASSVAGVVVGSALFVFGLVFFLTTQGFAGLFGDVPAFGGFATMFGLFPLIFMGVAAIIVIINLANIVRRRGVTMYEEEIERIDDDPRRPAPNQAGWGGQPTGDGTDDFERKLRSLEALKRDGLISPVEYERKRQEILSARW